MFCSSACLCKAVLDHLLFAFKVLIYSIIHVNYNEEAFMASMVCPACNPIGFVTGADTGTGRSKAEGYFADRITRCSCFTMREEVAKCSPVPEKQRERRRGKFEKTVSRVQT